MSFRGFVPCLPAGDAPVQVIGALFNHQAAWDAYASQMSKDPHKAPPKAPVLYLKPANTWAHSGACLEVPSDTADPHVLVGSTLGAVIGRRASGVAAGSAMDYIAGYTLVIDASLPQDSLYRSPIKFNARDGYCPMGPVVVPVEQIAEPQSLLIDTVIDDQWVHSLSLQSLVRPLPQLIADISEFMTLDVGDVILLGTAPDAPAARPGQMIRVQARTTNGGQSLGTLMAYVALEKRLDQQGVSV